MSGSKRISELTVTTTLSGNDRVVVLTNPASSAQTQTTTLTSLTNNLRYANTTVSGVVKVGNNLTINATGFLNAQASNTTMLTPSITYTGVFNGYPASLPISKGQGVYFTGNSYVLESSNKYWLATRFNTNDYDLSGTESLNFINIGGIQDNFRLGGKSETLLANVNLNDISVVTDYFYLTDLPALVTFNANNLAYVGGYFQINSMDNANTQLNFPNLKTIRGTFYYTYNDALENTPQFPALETINNSMYIYYNSATQNTMTFNSLEYAGYISIYENNGMLAGPVFSALTSMDYFDMNNNDNMIDPPEFPVLETITSNFYFYAHNSVTTAPATPSLVVARYIGWYDNIAMVNGFDFSSLKEVDGNVDISNCALDEASVDYILTTLAGLDGTNGTTSYDNRSVYLHNGTNAIPSATGLAAIATLEGRGCTVYYNSP